jgi:hypothetical protein
MTTQPATLTIRRATPADASTVYALVLENAAHRNEISAVSSTSGSGETSSVATTSSSCWPNATVWSWVCLERSEVDVDNTAAQQFYEWLGANLSTKIIDSWTPQRYAPPVAN